MRLYIVLAVVVITITSVISTGSAAVQPKVGDAFHVLTDGLQLMVGGQVTGNRSWRCTLGERTISFYINPYFASGEEWVRVALLQLPGQSSPFAAIAWDSQYIRRPSDIYIDQEGEGKITSIFHVPVSWEGVNPCAILEFAYKHRPLP